jgi:CubicO group peptidase (beta-lactamase class C family)
MTETIYKAGFGFESALRPDVPAYPDAMYKIASMTKTVTAVTILRLCQEEKLDLDIPIKNYLPWLKMSRSEASDFITLRHLLTHTSGLAADDWLPEGIRDEDRIENALRDTIPTLPMDALPGEGRYCYSDWGYDIAGCVASTVAGKRISELCKEYVLDPVGMQQTTFDYQIASTYPISLPHIRGEDGTPALVHYQRINMIFSGSAGLYSNAEDLCKWARFLLREGITDDGCRLLNSDRVEDMFSKHTPKTDAPGSFYGLGLFIRPFEDHYIYGHTGNYDPYNSSIFIDPKTGYGVVTLYNTDHNNESKPCYLIPEMILGDIADRLV